MAVVGSANCQVRPGFQPQLLDPTGDPKLRQGCHQIATTDQSQMVDPVGDQLLLLSGSENEGQAATVPQNQIRQLRRTHSEFHRELHSAFCSSLNVSV